MPSSLVLKSRFPEREALAGPEQRKCPAFDAASPGAAASNGTASRAAYIKAKTDRDDVMALAPVPVGPE